MKISTFIQRCIFALTFSLLTIAAFGQRNYATTQRTGTTGVCLACSPTDPANAADGNVQTYSVINVSVGLLATSWQEVIFPAAGKVPANTPVTIKLGSGDNLLNLTLLGGTLLQAYNGNTPVGQQVTAASLLSALSNNNQTEVTFTPNAIYDRVRITLDAGVLGALSSIYIYDAFYNSNGSTLCNTAVDELHGISSALLGLGLNVGGVVNPQNAIDGNITTASTLNAGVGLLGAYAQQTVIFNQPSVQGDSVKITFSLPAALLDAGVLANISVSTFNGNTSNNDNQTINGGLLTVRLLDLTANRQKIVVTYAPTAVFDRVQLRLGGGVASLLSSLDLYEIQRTIPSPVIKYNNVVTNSLQTCAGSAVTLVANAVPNTVFNWYTTQNGGSPVFTGTSFTTPALNTTTVYYVEAVRNGCTDASARTAVTVNVSAIPTAPVVINPAVTVCQGQAATFAVTNIPGITINWYAAATGGTPISTGDSYTTGPLSATTTYYAEATSGGGLCISPTRTAVTATVSPTPATPALTTPSLTICDGDVAVLTVASPVAGVTYNWYGTATGGTVLFTGTTFTSPALHNNTSYYVEAVNSTGCTSSARAQGTVTVTPKPADPTLLANSTTIAAGQTATITVSNNATGVTYNWYTSANAASPIFSGTTYTTPALFTTTTYYVGAVNSTGCTSVNRTAVTINVTVNTNTPCSFANAQSTNVNGLCIGCSIANPAIAVDADTTTASTIHIIAGLLGGYAEQELRFQQPGFAGDTIKIGLQTPVGLADVGLLNSIQVTVYNGTNAVNTYTLSSAAIKLSLIGAGNKYAVLIPATGAYDRVTVRLTSGAVTALTALNIYYAVQQFAPPVFNPTAPEICKGSAATLNITTPVNGGTYTWYTVPTGGTSVATGTTFTTPALTANTVYYVEYSRNGCVSPVRYAINVLTDDVPLKPTAAANPVNINSGQTATLTATATNGATVKWYSAATGGTPLATGNSFTTPVLNANTTYYAESSLGNCTSVDRTPVNVIVTPIVVPDITVTPPAQTINAGTTATFTASSTTPGTIFNWYTTPTGGTPIFTGAVYTTPAQFSNNIYYAEAVVQATNTPSATRATATITVSAIASSAVPCDAAIDQTNTVSSGVLCVGCAVNNAAAAVDADRNTFSQLSVPIGLLGSYAQQTLRFAATGRAGDSLVVELGTPGSLANVGLLSNISLATYNGATYNNDRFNVNGGLLTVTLLSGDSRFRVVFKATADFDRVEIRLNGTGASVLNTLNVYDASQEVAAPVITTNAVTACAGSQATLTATVPSYVTVKWYTAQAGGSPVFTGAVFTTPALNATTTYYAEASRTADGCTQTVRTPATVTVVPLPATPVVVVPNLTVCSGQTASFAATPTAGVTYNWYTASTGGTPVFTGNTFVTPALTATTSYYVEASNGTCGSTTRTQVTATVSNSVTDPTVAQATTTTCAGSSAVLTATSTQPGVIFKWYTAATGGTPVFTGAQFTTPTLSANTSYYVEASSGTCTSANRARADVVVNPTPAAPTVAIVPAGGQITSGQTATLTASSTTAGATFNWYNTATGGTAIATGATFTTPVLTSNTTYYVESALATGCTSTRTAVNITVNPIFSSTCDIANTQVSDVNGGLLCLLCAVNNPNNSVDADQTNYTTLSIPVGLVGSYVAQKLVFSESGAIGDSVSVKLQFPSALASVGVLDNIRIGSYNGNTYNNDGILLNSGLLHVQLLTGNTTAIIRFAPQAAFDRVEIRLNGSLASVLNSVDIGYASKQVEAPQLAVNTANICAGSTATFTVSNARAGVTYDWFTTPTGGASVHTGTTFTTPALSAATTYYVQSTRTVNSCPNPNRVAATVNVTPSPVTPTLAVNSINLCSGDNATLQVTNAGANTVRWYDAPTAGNLVFTGANFQVTPIANIIYYAELSNGTCTSPTRAAATIIINPRPAQPGVASNNLSVCTGAPATLTVLNPEANVVYNWFTTATGGTSVFTGATFTTPAIAANTTYYVQATSTVGGCINNGGRTQVNVTTNGQIANPTLSATATQVCSGGSASISVVNPINGLTYNWYSAATGGSLVFTGTTLTVNNLTANVSYFVEATNASGCVSASRTETDINVLPIPAAPTVQAAGSLSICQGASATLSIMNPQADLVYRWYNAATGGTILFTGTIFNTPALTANTTYYVEAAAAGNCNPSTRTPVTVTVNALPNDPVLASNNVSVCSGGTATFTISSPQSGVHYLWYDSPAKTNQLFDGTTFTTGALTTNTVYYVAASNASGCTSTNTISAQATVTTAPPAPIIANGSTVQTCSGTQVTLSIANPQAGFTYNWYDAAAGGNLVFTGPTFTTAALTSNVTYYASAVSSTGCTSASRTSVAITINPALSPPVITAQGGSTSPVICSGNSVVLTATSSSTNVIFNWYNAATGGTLLFTGATFNTGALSANTIYYVEAVSSVSGCASSARTAIAVNVTSPPATPVPAAATVTVCTGSPATLAVSAPLVGITYNWYSDAARTTLLSTGPTFITNPVNANTTYYVEATNGSCPSPLASVQVNINALPGAPTVANGSTVQDCSGSSITLNIGSPQAGYTYNWYTVATGGTPVFTGTSFTTAALTSSITYYAEAVNTTGCSSASRTQVTINVNDLPSAPVITDASGSTTPTVCSGTSATLKATSTTAGVTFNWYDAATGGNMVFTGATFNTAPLTANVIYYVSAVSAAGCTSTTRTAVAVTVTAPPAVPVPTASTVTICSGASATLGINSPVAGVNYRWYTDAARTNLVFTGPTFVTGPISANTTYYVEAASGSCASTAATVQVNVVAAPGTPVIANGATVQDCAGSSVTLNIASPQAGLTYNWYTAAVGGTLLFTGTSYTTPNLTSNTTYYAEAVNATGCNSSARAAVNINVNPIPVSPVVTATGGSTTPSICSGNTVTLNATSTTAGVVFNWYNAATGGNLVYTGASFTTAPLTSNVIYFVEAASPGTGCVSSSRTGIAVTVTTPPATPTLVSNNVTVCSGSPAMLSIATPLAGVTYKWYSDAARTNLLFTGPTYITGPLTANAVYYADASNGSCSSPSVVMAQATVIASPGAPIIANGATLQTCAGTQVTLNIASPQAGLTYNWYTAANGGVSLFTGTSYTTPVLSSNTTYYAEATNANGCASSTRTAVTITVNPLPASPVVTANGGSTNPSICSGNTVTLNATSTTAGVTFNWYSAATGGTLVYTGASFTTAPLSGNVIYYVEAVSGAGCSSSTRTAIAVTVSTPPATPTPVAPIVNVCSGSPTNLNVASPIAGTTYKWYTDAARTNLVFTGPSYTTGPITANATYYVDATNGTCSSPSAATVQVNVVALPGAPTVTSANVATCANTQAVLSIASPQAGFTYNWYSAATGGTSLFTGSSFTTPQISSTTTYYAEATNAGGCPSSTRTAVTVTVSPAPNAPTAGGTGLDICAGNSTVVTATSADPNVTIKWYTAASGGTAVATGTSYTTPVLNANTTYYAEAVSNSGGCTSATRTAVAVVVRQPLIAPTITNSGITSSSITFNWNSISGAVGYQVSLDNGATFITPSSGATGTSHTVSGLNVNTTVTILVRALGTTACQQSAAATATAKTDNPFGNGIYVPNAFTPNGDGKNDIEYVYSTNIKTMTFTVFDQYGEQVFRSTSVSSGWDGTYKGSKEPVGVYMYYLTATMNDGQTVQMKGSITLLR